MLLVVLLALLAILAVAVSAFLIWTQKTYAAEPEGISAVESDPRVHLDVQGDLTVLGPSAASNGTGLIFFPGAKVEPDAYAASFTELAANGTTVIIAQPSLNLALLERRSLEELASAAPDVESWSVGGHSMGGVRACMYAESDEVDALLLLASYCSGVDLSEHTDLAVLSVFGSDDGLIRTEAVEESKDILPSDAESVTLEGVSHAQFGDYGPQGGDGTPHLSDDEARQHIEEALAEFFQPTDR
ncbi:alpha/beta hydrolase [Microbacterium halophytorum]|uniref:alpha/beta hydrolase n=1 Tax=Microbacterium halophytorum TaxID=2067568 RepID=UPI001319E5AE|nr:alpha/beta hydrolase [Microbacterium halophytorum]